MRGHTDNETVATPRFAAGKSHRDTFLKVKAICSIAFFKSSSPSFNPGTEKTFICFIEASCSLLALFQTFFTELFKEIISLNLMSCQNDFYFRVSLPGIILLLLFIVVVLICFYFRKNI